MTDSSPAPSLWQALRDEARTLVSTMPLLSVMMNEQLLSPTQPAASISVVLSQLLADANMAPGTLAQLFQQQLSRHANLIDVMASDAVATKTRDSACHHYYQVWCFYKGFHALCSYRLAHTLWNDHQRQLALYLQSRASAVFDIDIHPAARIGHGVMLDHGSGIVIGETAAIGNNVSIMQGVTLGGTGKESGDRHPKISDGVLVSVGATILGNIRIGEGAQIAAGSVVLTEVPPHTIAAGVPAKMIGHTHSATPALQMDHTL